MEVKQSMFFNHNGVKLEINYRNKYGKLKNIWKLNNTLLNNQWVKEKLIQKIRKHIQISKNEDNILKLKEYSESRAWGKITAVNTYIKKEELFQIT